MQGKEIFCVSLEMHGIFTWSNIWESASGNDSIVLNNYKTKYLEKFLSKKEKKKGLFKNWPTLFHI